MQLNLKHIQSHKSVYVKFSKVFNGIEHLCFHLIMFIPLQVPTFRKKKKILSPSWRCRGKIDKASIVITFSRLISKALQKISKLFQPNQNIYSAQTPSLWAAFVADSGMTDSLFSRERKLKENGKFIKVDW